MAGFFGGFALGFAERATELREQDREKREEREQEVIQSLINQSSTYKQESKDRGNKIAVASSVMDQLNLDNPDATPNRDQVYSQLAANKFDRDKVINIFRENVSDPNFYSPSEKTFEELAGPTPTAPTAGMQAGTRLEGAGAALFGSGSQVSDERVRELEEQARLNPEALAASKGQTLTPSGRGGATSPFTQMTEADVAAASQARLPDIGPERAAFDASLKELDIPPTQFSDVYRGYLSAGSAEGKQQYINNLYDQFSRSVKMTDTMRQNYSKQIGSIAGISNPNTLKLLGMDADTPLDTQTSRNMLYSLMHRARNTGDFTKLDQALAGSARLPSLQEREDRIKLLKEATDYGKSIGVPTEDLKGFSIAMTSGSMQHMMENLQKSPQFRTGFTDTDAVFELNPNLENYVANSMFKVGEIGNILDEFRYSDGTANIGAALTESQDRNRHSAILGTARIIGNTMLENGMNGGNDPYGVVDLARMGVQKLENDFDEAVASGNGDALIEALDNNQPFLTQSTIAFLAQKPVVRENREIQGILNNYLSIAPKSATEREYFAMQSRMRTQENTVSPRSIIARLANEESTFEEEHQNISEALGYFSNILENPEISPEERDRVHQELAAFDAKLERFAPASAAVQPEAEPVEPEAEPVEPEAEPVQPEAEPVEPEAERLLEQIQKLNKTPEQVNSEEMFKELTAYMDKTRNIVDPVLKEAAGVLDENVEDFTDNVIDVAKSAGSFVVDAATFTPELLWEASKLPYRMVDGLVTIYTDQLRSNKRDRNMSERIRNRQKEKMRLDLMEIIPHVENQELKEKIETTLEELDGE